MAADDGCSRSVDVKAESVLLGVLRDIRHAGYSASLVKILAYRAVEFALRGDEVVAVGPGTLPVPVPLAYEQALLATGRAMGKCGKATVAEAKAYLRVYGVSGTKLASRLGRLSKCRNVEVHDLTFVAELAELLQGDYVDFVSQNEVAAANAAATAAAEHAATAARVAAESADAVKAAALSSGRQCSGCGEGSG